MMTSRNSYSTRSKTQYRGVTRVLNAKKNREKYDVQFVFSDGGVKKHPKMYGFMSAEQASRAFDVLGLKRYLEKNCASWKDAAQALTKGELQQSLTNHGEAEYARDDRLIELIFFSSRDQLVYGLKEVSRRRSVFSKESMLEDLCVAMMSVDRSCKDMVERICPDVYGKIKDGIFSRNGSSVLYVGDRIGSDVCGGPPRTSYENQSVLEQGPSHSVPIQSGTIDAVKREIKRKTNGRKRSRKDDDRGKNGSRVKDVKKQGPVERGSKDGMARDGLRLVFDMCRVSGANNPELRCCADLLYLWDSRQHGTSSEHGDEGILNHPGSVYQSILADMQGISDLREAMGYIWNIWSQGHLKKIWNQNESTSGFVDLRRSNPGAPSNIDLAPLHGLHFSLGATFADMQSIEDHTPQQ